MIARPARGERRTPALHEDGAPRVAVRLPFGREERASEIALRESGAESSSDVVSRNRTRRVR